MLPLPGKPVKPASNDPRQLFPSPDGASHYHPNCLHPRDNPGANPFSPLPTLPIKQSSDSPWAQLAGGCASNLRPTFFSVSCIHAHPTRSTSSLTSTLDARTAASRTSL